MSKKNAELNVAFQADGRAAKAVTVVLQGKDLYTVIHTPQLPFQAKHSYHASGVAHTKMSVLDQEIRSDSGRKESLAELTGFKLITGGGGPPPPIADYAIKPDKSRRKTLVLDLPAGVWGAEVWAVERHREALASKIAQTPPYADVACDALVADWSDPYLIVKVWRSQDKVSPYRVIRYDPPIPGRIPYILDPPSYRGTWLESCFPPRDSVEDRILEQFDSEQESGEPHD